jgi:transcriptional regulator with PAS, ATPase and Fis domain
LRRFQNRKYSGYLSLSADAAGSPSHPHFGEDPLFAASGLVIPAAETPQTTPPQYGREALDPFLGSSRVIQRLHDLACKVAACDSPVLIVGETGSGKGVLANWIHASSSRRQEEFLDLNCAGLDREFLETELFGHEKGAFTSAIAAKPGLLEVANHGTVFLDEIGDVGMQVQPKLLKVLETGRFRRLGDLRDRFADVRLISATHRDLGCEMQEGRFRPDLYYRINIIRLEVPALRRRPEDIPSLALRLLESMVSSHQETAMELDGSAIDALQKYSWPGNIRELRNVLQRAVLVAEGNVITDRELQFFPLRSDGLALDAPLAADLTLQQLERAHIETVLAQESGSIQKAAKRLGIPRSSLYNKLSRFGISNRA